MYTSASGIYVGEALAGDGNEVAHIDLLLGLKTSPVGPVFCSTLADQKAGHSDLLAVLAPNMAVKPDTVTFTKVTIKGAKQAMQMFGPGQFAVAMAVGDALAAGAFKNFVDPNDLCIVVGVFIHWQAENDQKIFEYNYEATRMALRQAISGGPSLDEVKTWVANVGQNEGLAHPFKGKFDLNASLTSLRAKFLTGAVI